MAKRVLIADDEPNIVTSLEFLLEHQGYEVLVAHDGQETLDLVESQRPDLVLLDVMMPVRNGYEVCQSIRANPDRGRIKVIMLTAKGRDIEATKGLAVGADAYVTKPFSTKELVETVRQMLEDGP